MKKKKKVFKKRNAYPLKTADWGRMMKFLDYLWDKDAVSQTGEQIQGIVDIKSGRESLSIYDE